MYIKCFKYFLVYFFFIKVIDNTSKLIFIIYSKLICYIRFNTDLMQYCICLMVIIIGCFKLNKNKTEQKNNHYKQEILIIFEKKNVIN